MNNSTTSCNAFLKSESGSRITLDDFEVLKPIGEGAYGKVFLVRKKESGTLFAMKKLKKSSLTVHHKTIEHTRSERAILPQLDHPFIVTLHFAFQTKENLFLILQYAPGGTLFSYLAKERMFSETQASFYIGEILLALEYVHSQSIIYRDLKPENVLLDAHGHVLLTDFGLSKVVLETLTVCGTIEYMAPEVLNETLLYGGAVDFWSLGIVLFDFLAGSPPFKGSNRKKIMDAIMHQKPKFPKFFLPQATNLIGKLLVKDPTDRIGYKLGAAEIKKHSFFRKTDWVKLMARQVLPPFKPGAEMLVDEFGQPGPDFSVQNYWDALQGGSLTISEESRNALASDCFRGFSFIAEAGI
ncbi:serine/threonine protein kinase psk1 [Podochytrium sp. JEL0797]|nr:serine/threonine protein kinase psk1 [Podochytrium sp. JEL0797]